MAIPRDRITKHGQWVGNRFVFHDDEADLIMKFVEECFTFRHRHRTETGTICASATIGDVTVVTHGALTTRWGVELSDQNKETVSIVVSLLVNSLDITFEFTNKERAFEMMTIVRLGL